MDGDQQDKELKFSFSNHLSALFSIIIGIVISSIILIVLNFEQNAIIVFGLWIGLDILATLYLHIDYWFKNKGESYLITRNSITRYKYGIKEEYLLNKIKQIKINISPAMYRGSNFHLFGIEAYHYAEVQLVDGSSFIITSLLSKNLVNSLKILDNVKIKKRIYNQLPD